MNTHTRDLHRRRPVGALELFRVPGRSARTPPPEEKPPEERGSPIPLALCLSVPIAALGTAASLAGILLDVYDQETENWAAQAVAQDIANLVVFPALLLFAYLASRGSLRAYLVWIGALGYSAYSYAIYSFSTHFGSLFLVYVAVLGLSTYALVGGLARLDADRVKASFGPRAPTRSTSALLIALGAVFSVVWLSEIVPTILDGRAPQSLVDAGLPSNPVYVLDLALFLPAAILGGVLLLKRRAFGYCLAPLALGTMIFLGLGILSIQAVFAARSLEPAWGVAIAIGIVTALEVLALARFLRAADRSVDLRAVLRPTRNAETHTGLAPVLPQNAGRKARDRQQVSRRSW